MPSATPACSSASTNSPHDDTTYRLPRSSTGRSRSHRSTRSACVSLRGRRRKGWVLCGLGARRARSESRSQTSYEGAMRARYHDTGPESGPPLLLLHAFPLSSDAFAAQLALPARVIAPDHRGFGNGAPTDGTAVAMEEYARDALAVLDALDVRRCV